jgi:hypothetical protein
LTQAQIFVRRVIISGADHFWSADPFENEPNSYGATAAPHLLRFLGVVVSASSSTCFANIINSNGARVYRIIRLRG